MGRAGPRLAATSVQMVQSSNTMSSKSLAFVPKTNPNSLSTGESGLRRSAKGRRSVDTNRHTCAHQKSEGESMEITDPNTVRLFSAIVLAKAGRCRTEDLLDAILRWAPLESAVSAAL